MIFPLPELVYLGWTYIVINAVLLFTKPKEVTKENEDPAVFLNFLKREQQVYKYIEASPYELLAGYDINLKPLFADMKKYPHLLVSGLGNQGKSWCVKQMIKNLTGANYVVLNGFREDFEDAIIGNDINEFFKTLLGNLVVQEKPFYIFIDELATVTDKTTLKYIERILCDGRHFNIFVVGIIQRPSKKSLEFKDLFNTVISFRQRDETNYRLVFNSGIDVILKPREFVMMTDDLYFGETYLITDVKSDDNLIVV